MITAYVKNAAGKRFQLPALRAWDLRYTLGNPCDAFEVRFLYDAETMESLLLQAVSFQLVQDGVTVFTGFIDEACACADTDGLTVTLSGRGPAARLIDNEAPPAVYYNASLDFILDRHVRPFGLSPVRIPSCPGLSKFTVSTGVSQWSVLRDFLSLTIGKSPRFSPVGELLLDDPDGKSLAVDNTVAVSSALRRITRHGVLSSVLVQCKSTGAALTVQNDGFLALGGCASRVLSVPRSASYADMLGKGQQQIDRAKEELEVCTLTLPQPFAAFPADIIRLRHSPVVPDGSYRVSAARCRAGRDGITTQLTLIPKEVS
ncbi:MAG: hypothetical protein Q4A39_01970 [Eubacteriales bacterium]|nr:hypothetical protein [Eubacteriales bacterium]